MDIAKVLPYFAIPYHPDNFDCADLVVKVQREVYGREIELPGVRNRKAMGQRQIQREIHRYVTRTETPTDGDIVLMQDVGSDFAGHVGVYLSLAGDPGVLHTSATLSTAVTRIREFQQVGIKLEGYYTWTRTPPSPSPRTP